MYVRRVSIEDNVSDGHSPSEESDGRSERGAHSGSDEVEVEALRGRAGLRSGTVQWVYQPRRV